MRRRARGDAAPAVYLDHHATTPCDPRVLQAMLPCFAEDFGNPSSLQHAWGRRAAERVEKARQQVASLIGAEASEIVFTSGATEADNLAILGVVDAARQVDSRASRAGQHVVTEVTEHKAVLDACAELERRGVAVSYLPVDSDGRLDPDRVEHALRPETVLVSVMLANNEIGVVQPLDEISRRCRRVGVPLHTDAAQALAVLDCRLEVLGADLMSLSAHKAYGPKGVGALYVRRRRPRVRLHPQQHGGGHERGRRSGTLDVPSIVGFGEACALIAEQRETDVSRLASLRDRLLAGLLVAFPDLQINGSMDRLPNHRLPNNLNVSLPGLVASELLDEVEGLAISSGSACTSSSGASSHVLAALGGRERAESALRFGLGRGTSSSDIDYAVAELARAASVVRQRGPKLGGQGLEVGCGVLTSGVAE